MVDLRKPFHAEHGEFSLMHGTWHTSPQLSGNNLRYSECNYCTFHLPIGGRSEFKLGSESHICFVDHSVPGPSASRSHKYNRHARADYLGGVSLLTAFGSELHYPIGNVGDSFAVDPIVEKWRSPCDHGPRVVCLNFPRGASCSRRRG